MGPLNLRWKVSSLPVKGMAQRREIDIVPAATWVPTMKKRSGAWRQSVIYSINADCAVYLHLRWGTGNGLLREKDHVMTPAEMEKSTIFRARVRRETDVTALLLQGFERKIE